MKDTLANKKMCLRCKHLWVNTEDPSRKICICPNPFLIPATEIHSMGIADLRRKYKFYEEALDKEVK